MNQGIYGLGGQVTTPVQGPFSGAADARKLLSVQALVVGGGGGGASGQNGGPRPGPGGGGGGVVDITSLGVMLQTSYIVSIAAGAAQATIGNASRFGQIVAIGGGQGNNGGGAVALSGATGGGSNSSFLRWASIAPSQGFSGGVSINSQLAMPGGGGAGAQGGDAITGASAAGGIGRGSMINGTLVYYGGGGGGGAYVGTSTPGAGGLTGGGAGSSAVASPGTSGTSSTGGGGGGGAHDGTTVGSGGSGGSGVVILRWNASQAQITVGTGLAFTRTTVGTDTVITITGGTGTVTFN